MDSCFPLEPQLPSSIIKIVYPETPPHVEYMLTPISEKLHPVFKALYGWGQEYEVTIKLDGHS
ncbi:winged helix-turn-helix transcriptional regulator [Bifidobacterium breve]|uniref:winged helix-turn-helix transcriptional regulator n=1 Tax=Bifidobacterium breve TaxID=1685 RepID=UPI0034E88169